MTPPTPPGANARSTPMTMMREYAAGLALVVTDRSQVDRDRSLLDVVAAALEGGAHGVLVRERDLPGEERAALVDAVGELCVAHRALLLVASPLPLRNGAFTSERGVHPGTGHSPRNGAGVHLRRGEPVPEQLDRGRLLVGRSCHDLAELRRACDDAVDYATLSPAATTASKPGYGPALGVAGLRDLVATIRSEREEHSEVPGHPALLALGGVDATNAGYWVEAGADGVAVMGAVMRAADPAAEMRGIVESVRAARDLAR